MGKQKVAQEVDGKVRLVAVGGEFKGCEHDSSIVQQQVHLRIPLLDELGKGLHRLQVPNVQLLTDELTLGRC